MFKVGDKVVCIDDKIKEHAKEYHDKYFKNWIKQDETYTIRKVDGEGYAVLLEEITNPPVYIPALLGKTEPRFLADRFRKLEKIQETVAIEDEFVAVAE